MSNPVLYKTTEWRRRIAVTEASGTATDLTGKVLKLEVRRRTGEAALLTLTSGAGITHLAQSGATLGLADIVITTAQSAALDAPTLHVINVQLDNQVITEPQFLEVVAL